MNVDVAVITESHLTRKAEGRRSDLVVRSGSGLTRTNVDKARFGHEDLIRLLIRKNLCKSLTCEK
jgi:DNA-binding Xre family transcriptional regulator